MARTGHQLVLHLNNPEPVMLSWLSTNQNESVIRSKAVWEQAGGELVEWEPNDAGLQEMQTNPIGTGPYQFEEFLEDQYILYGPTGYDHWRISPDFPTVQIFFVREASTTWPCCRPMRSMPPTSQGTFSQPRRPRDSKY